MALIYSAENLTTGQRYVGSTRQKFKIRISHHFHAAFSQRKNNKFHTALREYGKEAFSWTILDTLPENANAYQIAQAEWYWIQYFDTQENGYNTKSDLTGNFTEEARENMREAAKRRWKGSVGKKRVIACSNGEIFSSVKEAIEKYGKTVESQLYHGRGPSRTGLVFTYLEPTRA